MSGDTKSNHWVRRRGYSKVHVKSWTIYLEKNGYVKCPFQNCNFMAFDVEEMYQHYSICNGDSSFAKFVCSICQGRTVTAEKLKNHKLKAHDVAEIESDDMDSIDHDESSNDDTNDSTIKKAALSKVVILSWKCSLEENKYIKCPECDYLERDVSAMVNHYLDCKKDSVIACYVCPECKGKAISFDILQCHMSYAHKVDISKMNFNKISPRTVQIWYDEIAHNKFARCLHKSQGVVDCLYFDTDISGIILHYQACTGAESSVGPRHTCPTCKHWTDSEEKIKVHIESCHISSITFVSRLIENNTTRNSKNLDINNCNKSKIPLRDFKVKPLGKSVNAEAAVGKSMFIRKEEETVRRKSTEDEMCRRNSREQESNILKDSIGYNLYDDVEVIDITDGKTDLNEDVEFVSADSKQSEQPLIDLPPNVSDDASITYCLNKEEGTFLHCGVVNPPTRGDWTRYKDAFRGVSISLVETKPVESTTNVQSVVCSESKKKDLSSPPKLGITKLPKSPQNTTQSVDQNKSNDNVKPDNADINTLVLSEAVEVSDTEGKGNSRVDEKSSKSIVNHSLNSSGKVRAECRQESYRDEDRSHSVEIIDVKNHESEVEQREKEDTVCNYMVEVCNEDVNKGVLCFKITDLEESRSTVDPVADESVYVVSANLADTKDVQNTTVADDRNKVVNDSSKSCTLSSTDSVNRETQEVASSSVGNNCPVVTSSGSHDDDEPPRIVQFFKKGRLSNTSSASEEKKVVCIEYKKGALFRSRLCRTKCKPVFDDKKPSCSGIERIERKHHSCLNATGEASSSKLISDTNRDAVETTSSVGIQMDTSRVVCETATSVGVQINDNEPELLPEKDALDIVKGNDTQEVKSGNSGSTKVIHDKVVKGDVEESTASERILDNRETTSNADELAVGTVHKNSNKDKNKDEQKNESDPDNTSIMKAAQLHNPLKSKSSDLEDVKCSSEHYMDTSSKRVNTMKEATIIEKQNNNTEEEVCKKKADICLEEYSGKDEKNKGETAASERFLKNEEANAPKRVKHVGVRVSLGVQIKEMSEAKLRKMKKPIKNLVRKFCKEELRKYRSCKKYFHSKKPIKNFGKRIKYEKDTVREEKLSASLTSKIVGDKDELCRNLSVMDSGHQKPEDTCVSRRKTEEVMDKGNDLNSIDIHTEEREAKVIDTAKELALQRTNEAFDSGDDSDNASVSVDRDSELEPTKRTPVVQTQTFCKIQPAGVDSSQPQDDNQLTENLADKKDTITSKIIVYDTTDPVNTVCDRESANCVPCKELNSNTSLKKYVGKKDEITDVKDAQISQSSAKKVDKCLTKDEMKEISTVENSSGTCEEQESSTSKNVKPVLNELKTAEESDSGEQVKTSAPPKQYLIKKAEVKEYRNRSGISSGRKCLLTEGQDKTAKCEDDSTLCLVGNVDHSVLSAHTSGESKFLSNSKREEISMDSAQIEEPEMNLVRKVKYVDELEANYSSKKIIVHDVDNDNDNEEILIYLTEDAECNTSDNIDGDRNKESDESTKKTESSESMQTDGKPSEECEQPASTSTVTPPSDSVTPVKRRRGRPSKQEMLQRQLNQSVATDTPSHVVDNALASSTPNTQSRLRIRTCISRRYLEDYSPPFSYSERKKRSRNRHVWYMTPETSNDSTDSSQPSSKRGKNLRTGKGSSSEDECRNEEIYKEHSEKINSDGKNEHGSNKDEKSVAEGESKRIEQSNLNDTSVSSEATPVKRKRGRPRKNVNVSSDLSQNNTVKELALQRAKEALDSGDDGDNASVSVGGDSESEPPKRRPVIKTETFCNIQFGEIDSNPPQDDNTLALHEIVKCGKCGEEMPRKKYLREHKMKHYNLCWLEGEQPIDFSNQDEVVNLLLRAQKKFRMKTAFKCETCGVSKKSAAGYQSHLVFCGKSKEERDALMESCPVCGRIMMPSSLKVHMHNAHSNKLVSTNEEMVQEEEIQNFVRGKRAAATKAESALQDSLGDVDDIEVTQKKRSRSPIDDIARQLYKRPAHNTNPYQIGKWRRMIAERGFGACYFPMCTFQSNDIEALRDHSKSCTHSPPKIYSCRMCEFDSIEETAMVAHVREKHEKRVLAASHSVNSEVSSSEDEDGNELTIMSHRTTPFMSKYPKLKFVRDMGKVYGSRFFHHALRITYDMREENYSKGILFNGLKPNPSEWTSMEDDEIEKYLPKTRTSVRLVTKNVEWHQIQLFESDFIDGVLTLFAGGPVWAAAWAPVCDLESQQYLAVACHPDMDLEHAMGRTYTYKSLIQIWKFDHLDNTKSDVTKPKLIYGIAHDHGAVWTLEWCPSGCYQDDRIGIFVAACSDGFIYIYSVPREDADGSCKICKPKPSAVLNLGSEMIAQCTRLSWHKVKPHSVIAAGFASGMVGVWDLNTNSPLLRCDNMYYPFHVFQPHQSSVSGLCFGPSVDPQYLATASVDCSHKFWDLRDTTAPVAIHRKGCVTDMVWMQNWLSTVNAYDEVYGYAMSSVLLNAYRDFCYQPCSLLPQTGVTWSLSCNDWINGIACGDETGRVVISLPWQIAHIDEKKVKKNSKLALLNTLHDFGEIQEVKLPQDEEENSDIHMKEQKEGSSASNQPEDAATFLTYNEAVARYGLSLKVDKQGLGIDQLQNKPKNPLSNPNMYPLTSVTKVSWNTNFRSFLYLAAGFHCGIVVIPRTPYVRSGDLVSLYRRKGGMK